MSDLARILEQFWGYHSFRPLQREAMEAVLAGRDSLLVLPTWVMHRDAFKSMNYGEEIVNEPMQRLLAEDKLIAHRYDGFWACMDTFKEKMTLDDLTHKGAAPWMVWANKPVATRNAV